MKNFFFSFISVLLCYAASAQCTAPVVTASGPTTLCSGGTVSLSAPASNAWTQKADLGGNQRSNAVGFSIGSKGYIGTGSNQSSVFKDFWEYNPATDAWTQKADFGGGNREMAAGFSIGTKGYIGTGNDESNYQKDFWEYNPSANIWTRKADFGGTVRSGAVGFSIDNKGYMGTGFYGIPTYYRDFWEYDPPTNTWVQKADFGGAARFSAVGLSIGSKGYIGTGSGDNTYKDFWEYNPSANSWSQRADFGGGLRSSATGFSIGSNGYIGMGYNNGYSREFWAYNPSTNTWTQKVDFSGTGRTGAASFSIGSKGYISTGFRGGYGYYKEFWECDPGYTYSWSPGGQTSSFISVNTSGNYTVTTTNALGCSATSAATAVTVNPVVTPAVSISAGSSTICSGTSVTFTATPTNGGTTPAYQWQKNGSAISGATGATYSTSSLTNNDVIRIVMTSNVACATNATVTSNHITISVIENTGGVIYVDASRTSVSGSGISWANAYKELSDALNAARQCANITSILVAKGTYKPTINSNRDSAFTLLRGGLKIYGGYPSGGGTRNIIDNPSILSGNIGALNNNGDNSYHVLVVAGLASTSDSLVIDGFTITGGNANVAGSQYPYGEQLLWKDLGAGIYLTQNANGQKLALRNLIIESNNSNHYGGGMFTESSSPALTNCTFTNNTTDAGGGMYNSSSSPVLNNCSFSANTSNYGGGMFNNSSSPVLTNCTFSNNLSGYGGGMFNLTSAVPIINNCAFNANSASSGGGGVFNQSSAPRFNSCTFVANTAGYGGGLLNQTSAAPAIANCTFSTNSASVAGGGLFNESSSSPAITNCIFSANTSAYGGGMFNQTSAAPAITNCTFSANRAGTAGGGICNETSATPAITNCIIWGNSNDGVFNNSATPTISFSIVQGTAIYTGIGNLNADPLFMNTASPAGADGIFGTVDDGLQLQPCSPAVNTGSNTAISGFGSDITGRPRIYNSTVDMGAYELQTGPSNTIGLALNGDNGTFLTAPNQTAQLTTDCRTIARITSTGATPLTGNLAARVWVDAAQSFINGQTYVKRHYQLAPANSAATATARITLYATQQEFSDFNTVSNSKLPANATDMVGITNLRIFKFSGVSSNGTGAPGSYPEWGTELNPADNDIVWNSSLARWEITFDVTGFSGFFFGNAGYNILPLTLLNFSGKAPDNSSAQLSWRTANEVKVSHFELQRSRDGRNFSPVIRVQARGTAQNETDYSFTDKNLADGGYYYRLRLVDKDGKETYSQVVTVVLKSSHTITLYPVPAQNNIWLGGGTATLAGKNAVLVDVQGRVLQTVRISQWPQQVDVSVLAAGVYLIKIEGEKSVTFIKQ